MTPKEHLILIARKKTLLPDIYEQGVIYPGILISTQEYTGLYFPGDYIYLYKVNGSVDIEGEIVAINQATANSTYYLVVSESGELVDNLRIDKRLKEFTSSDYRYRWLISSNNISFKPQLTF